METSIWSFLKDCWCGEYCSKGVTWVILMVLRSCWFIQTGLRKSFQGLLVDKVHLTASTNSETFAKLGRESGPTCSFHPQRRYITSSSGLEGMVLPATVPASEYSLYWCRTQKVDHVFIYFSPVAKSWVQKTPKKSHLGWFYSFSEKDLFYFYCKVRYTERSRDREEDLPSNDSLPKWLQWPVLCQSQVRI